MSTHTDRGLAARILGVAAGDLPLEGTIGSFDGATAWLNSAPLTSASLRGHVVVVQFWTYTCINWLRTQAYYRAWSQRYRDQGLVTIGVHTPEFKFEHDLDNVRWAVSARKIDYPVAIDNDFEVWRAFNNNYWLALYSVSPSDSEFALLTDQLIHPLLHNRGVSARVDIGSVGRRGALTVDQNAKQLAHGRTQEAKGTSV